MYYLVYAERERRPGIINLGSDSLIILFSQMSTLPSNISYNTLLINRHGGVEISIPRRELFDIRAQLMAEEMQDGQQLLVGLDQDDIKTNIYEGGFKTWECSLDLAKYITEIGAEGHGSRVGKSHYVEVRTTQD